jgi:hypothetical protein
MNGRVTHRWRGPCAAAHQRPYALPHLTAPSARRLVGFRTARAHLPLETFDSRVGPRAKGSLKSLLLVHEVAGHQVSTWPRPCWARSWMTRYARDPRPQTWTKKTA